MNRSKILRVTILLGALFTLVPQQLLAAPSQPANSVIVEPASLNFSLSSANPEKVAMLTIHNRYKTSLRMSAELRGIDENGGRIIPIGDPHDSIRDALKISATEFEIPPNSDYFLKVSATNNSKLPPGGSYSTLVLSETSSSNNPNALKPSLSVGIFLVKQHGAISNIVLSGHELHKNLFGYPNSITLETLNDGNVHQTPRASIRLIDSRNNILTEAIYNQESKIILPGKKLSQTIQFPKPRNSILPQRITLEISYRADGIDNPLIYKQTFWYIPPLAWIGMAVLIAALAAATAKYRKNIKKFSHHILRKK